MTPAAIATDIAELALRRIGQQYDEWKSWKDLHPYGGFAYHRAMASVLAPWRRIAIGRHKRLAQRYRVMWEASAEHGKCRAAEVASLAAPVAEEGEA